MATFISDEFCEGGVPPRMPGENSNQILPSVPPQVQAHSSQNTNAMANDGIIPQVDAFATTLPASLYEQTPENEATTDCRNNLHLGISTRKEFTTSHRMLMAELEASNSRILAAVDSLNAEITAQHVSLDTLKKLLDEIGGDAKAATKFIDAAESPTPSFKAQLLESFKSLTQISLDKARKEMQDILLLQENIEKFTQDLRSCLP